MSDARTTYCQHSWFQCGIPMQGTLSKWTLLVQTVRYPDWWKLFWSANKRIVHIYINSIIQRLKYNLYSVDSDILYLTSTFPYSSLLLNLLAMHDSAAMGDQILRKPFDIWLIYKPYNFTTNMLKAYLSMHLAFLFECLYDRQDSYRWPKASQKTAKRKSVW